MKIKLIAIALFCFAANAISQDVEIKLSGPAAVISYPLMVMADQQSLAEQGVSFSFTRWKNPDQLRALIIGGQVDVSAMPSNLAAIFFNKGHELTLLNISVWDIMTIVSRDPNLTTLTGLAGKQIVVPFKNDMPTILLNQLLSKQLAANSNSVKQRTSHNLLDSSQLLLAGQVDYALLIEPVTSMVIHRNSQQNGKPIYRSINISKQWQQTFPTSPALPQAGIIANKTIRGKTALLKQINQLYQSKAKWCKNEPEQCAKIVTKFLPKAPEAALVEAIKHTELEARTAADIKPELEGFFKVLQGTNAKLIGSKLPADNFYFSGLNNG